MVVINLSLFYWKKYSIPSFAQRKSIIFTWGKLVTWPLDITSGDNANTKKVFHFSDMPQYWYIWKLPYESVKTFLPYLRVFTDLGVSMTSFLLRYLLFCAILGQFRYSYSVEKNQQTKQMLNKKKTVGLRSVSIYELKRFERVKNTAAVTHLGSRTACWAVTAGPHPSMAPPARASRWSTAWTTPRTCMMSHRWECQLQMRKPQMLISGWLKGGRPTGRRWRTRSQTSDPTLWWSGTIPPGRVSNCDKADTGKREMGHTHHRVQRFHWYL